MPAIRYYRFTVTPTQKFLRGFYFPLDMLRYDACYPSTSEDADKLDTAIKERQTDVKITLTSTSPPTEGRWNSFGWEVVETRKY